MNSKKNPGSGKKKKITSQNAGKKQCNIVSGMGSKSVLLLPHIQKIPLVWKAKNTKAEKKNPGLAMEDPGSGLKLSDEDPLHPPILRLPQWTTLIQSTLDEASSNMFEGESGFYKEKTGLNTSSLNLGGSEPLDI